MPYYETLPRWLRLIGRGLRISTYVLLFLAGVGDVFVPSPAIASTPIRFVIGWALMVLATAALVAVVGHRWRWEWVTVYFLASAFALRAAVVWSYGGPPPVLSSGAIVTYVMVTLLLRGIDLTVFAYRTAAWVLPAMYRRA